MRKMVEGDIDGKVKEVDLGGNVVSYEDRLRRKVNSWIELELFSGREISLRLRLRISILRCSRKIHSVADGKYS